MRRKSQQVEGASSVKRSRRIAGAAIAAAALAATVPTEPADAYVVLGYGCRYNPGNYYDGLGVGYFWGFLSAGTATEAIYLDQTSNAAARWNQMFGPHFTTVPYGASTMDLGVFVSWSLGPNGSIAKTWFDCGGSHYDYDPLIEWNANYVRPNVYRLGTAIHEIGHSYGLEHNQYQTCDPNLSGMMFTPSSQKYDACGWTFPSSDDAKGAGSIKAGNY